MLNDKALIDGRPDLFAQLRRVQPNEVKFAGEWGTDPDGPPDTHPVHRQTGRAWAAILNQ